MALDRTNRRNHPRRLGALVAVGALLSLVPVGTAFAAQSDPTSAQYSTAVTQAGGQNHGTLVAAGTHAVGLKQSVISGLPFTGLDLIALFGVALVLISTGFILRRLTNKRGQIL